MPVSAGLNQFLPVSASFCQFLPPGRELSFLPAEITTLRVRQLFDIYGEARWHVSGVLDTCHQVITTGVT